MPQTSPQHASSDPEAQTITRCKGIIGGVLRALQTTGSKRIEQTTLADFEVDLRGVLSDLYAIKDHLRSFQAIYNPLRQAVTELATAQDVSDARRGKKAVAKGYHMCLMDCEVGLMRALEELEKSTGGSRARI